jgi:hypothetical protein
MSDSKNAPKTVRNDMQVKQQIFHNLLELSELYPQYTIAQHLAAITRRKSAEGEEFFHWDNKKLLKKIEQHKEELENELLTDDTEESN